MYTVGFTKTTTADMEAAYKFLAEAFVYAIKTQVPVVRDNVSRLVNGVANVDIGSASRSLGRTIKNNLPVRSDFTRQGMSFFVESALDSLEGYTREEYEAGDEVWKKRTERRAAIKEENGYQIVRADRIIQVEARPVIFLGDCSLLGRFEGASEPREPSAETQITSVMSASIIENAGRLTP